MDELSEFFDEMASSLPMNGDSFVIMENSLPCPHNPIFTKQLVINKGEHDYGSSFRIDQLWFFAHQQTYRQLGLLILACVFSKDVDRVELLLTHEQSDIKTIIIESEKLKAEQLITSGYYAKPFAFVYEAKAIQELHPLYGLQVNDYDLPQILLTNQEDLCLTEEDWKTRSIVRGFGTPLGATHLAQLLLNISSPETDKTEFYLESYSGYKSVAPWSAEARLWLPGGYYWNDSLYP